MVSEWRSYSKTVAEKRAWELQKGKRCGHSPAHAVMVCHIRAQPPHMCVPNCSWDLVTVLPGAVFGPPLSDRTSGQSINMLKVRSPL